VNPWQWFGQAGNPVADWFFALLTAVGTAGAALVAVYVLTLAWPFITGWMAKFRRAGNGRAGS
jgi:hypothetical protein